MSISYYRCSGCNSTYREDEGDRCDCDYKFCDAECGVLHNYGEWNNDTESHRIDDDEDISCKICRMEYASNNTLFETLLKHFNITRKQAFDIYKDQK